VCSTRDRSAIMTAATGPIMRIAPTARGALT
jgi:hypothetical protein